MADLPTGTVALLFTDMEGSTRLWELAPDAVRTAMARHDTLVEARTAHHAGHVVRPRGEGDSRFAVSVRAREGVAAARDLQQAPNAEAWPTPTPLQRPEHIYQLDIPGRPGTFAPLQSVAVFRNNLPVQLTSFVGRERELAEVEALLTSTHLP